MDAGSYTIRGVALGACLETVFLFLPVYNLFPILTYPKQIYGVKASP